MSSQKQQLRSIRTKLVAFADEQADDNEAQDNRPIKHQSAKQIIFTVNQLMEHLKQQAQLLFHKASKVCVYFVADDALTHEFHARGSDKPIRITYIRPKAIAFVDAETGKYKLHDMKLFREANGDDVGIRFNADYMHGLLKDNDVNVLTITNIQQRSDKGYTYYHSEVNIQPEMKKLNDAVLKAATDDTPFTFRKLAQVKQPTDADLDDSDSLIDHL